MKGFKILALSSALLLSLAGVGAEDAGAVGNKVDPAVETENRAEDKAVGDSAEAAVD